MNMRRKLCAAVALWAGAAVSAQADDLLNSLSAPPQGLEVVSGGQEDSSIQQTSFAMFPENQCGAACGANAGCCDKDARACCNKDAACGGSCGAGCGCDGGGIGGGDGLLDFVF